MPAPLLAAVFVSHCGDADTGFEGWSGQPVGGASIDPGYDIPSLPTIAAVKTMRSCTVGAVNVVGPCMETAHHIVDIRVVPVGGVAVLGV